MASQGALTAATEATLPVLDQPEADFALVVVTARRDLPAIHLYRVAGSAELVGVAAPDLARHLVPLVPVQRMAVVGHLVDAMPAPDLDELFVLDLGVPSCDDLAFRPQWHPPLLTGPIASALALLVSNEC